MKSIQGMSVQKSIEFLKNVDKKAWLKMAIVGIASLLFIVILVVPAWMERPFLRREVLSMEAQIRQVNALSQKRLQWEENQKVFGALIEKTKTRLFTAEDLSVLLGLVSKMGSESRVEVLASKPTDEKKLFQAPYHLQYQPSGYEFTLQGGYHSLASMVDLIESHEKLLRIQAFQIVPSEVAQDRHVAEMKLWAILKAPPQAAAPAVGAKNVKK